MADPKIVPPGGYGNLQRANWVRSRTAELRQALHRGTVDPVHLVRGDDPAWEPIIKRLRLVTVLQSIRGFGPVTTRDALEYVDLPADIRLHALTYAKRGEIADVVHYLLHGIPRQGADPSSPLAPPAV